jgi:hypothetical protein
MKLRRDTGDKNKRKSNGDGLKEEATPKGRQRSELGNWVLQNIQTPLKHI